MEEQSRIAQLEEELRLCRAEIQDLQARLGGADARPHLEAEQTEESAEHGDKHEAALAARRQEVESLRATVDSKNQEISEMKQKIQQTSKENVEMMDAWKVPALLLPDALGHCPLLVAAGNEPALSGDGDAVASALFYPDKLLPPQAKFDTLMSDHQRSMEELKVTLSSSPVTPAGQEPDAQELRATLEALKMEHQLEMENLKAKQKIEAALLTKEREDLSTRLQELKEQLTEASQPWRSEPEARSGTHVLEEVSQKLQKAERRVAEVEQKLKLSEKMMADYEALQKAQRESQEDMQKLEEKLRVTANQLQAVQADRYTSQDANVRSHQSESRQPWQLRL